VFFHATARQSKQWPSEYWVQTGNFIAQHGMPVLLPWGCQAELDAAKAMARKMTNAIVLPRLSMLEAVLLAQRADLAIGVDTGLTHIAAAYCRPTIELYCDSPRWNTEGNWSPKIINLGDCGRSPRTEEVHASINYLLQKN
jgi:heptosyltransferase-1